MNDDAKRALGWLMEDLREWVMTQATAFANGKEVHDEHINEVSDTLFQAIGMDKFEEHVQWVLGMVREEGGEA